jgi:hypothetical protein
MDAAELELLAHTLRDAVETKGSVATADAALSELGWLDMLADAPADAVEIVFTALGATGRTATVLDDVVMHALGIAPHGDLAMVFPGFGRRDPTGRAEGGRVSATGLATARATFATELLLVSADGHETRLTRVAADAAEITPVTGIDPDASLHVVRLDVPHATDDVVARTTWDAAVSWGQRAIAYQTSGATRTMLELARTHAVERVQFGRPIARFQAVRHRLAEALVAIESLDAALLAARDEPNPETAALAKILAGRTARTVAAHCQQVLAGIGFTTDHPFHRYLKRTVMLDGLLGSADELALQLGRDVLRTRTVPMLIEL